MVITKKILDELTAKAKENPRLHQSLDLRNSADNQSQRMLNAGALQEPRLGKFKELLELSEQYRRKNQYV